MGRVFASFLLSSFCLAVDVRRYLVCESVVFAISSVVFHARISWSRLGGGEGGRGLWVRIGLWWKVYVRLSGTGLPGSLWKLSIPQRNELVGFSWWNLVVESI